MAGRQSVLSWLHIGDLHITGAGEPNHDALRRIVALADGLPPGAVDFAVLPGDNADDGTPEQFRIVADAVAGLGLKLHILPGDHDFKPRSLDSYYGELGARQLPFAIEAAGHRCLFLDVVSEGSGGPDFRLGEAQLAWVERELDAAEAAGETAVIFMHTYPADLRAGGERLRAALGRRHVLCVDMGHTHYNELANDGGTIFMATRSTGQVEEGPAGFSIAAVDGGCVSWRFKSIEDAWPFVLVTRPADRRLATRASLAADGALAVRAKMFGDAPIEAAEASLDDGEWLPMTPAPSEPGLWEARGSAPFRRVLVRARDANGRLDEDRVELADPGWTPPERAGDGSDRDRIGAWPGKGILDTQLGPNRNGRKW